MKGTTVSISTPGVRRVGRRLATVAGHDLEFHMARYLISFNDGDMTFPEEDLPEVARAAQAVVQQAKDAGVFVFAGGFGDPGKTTMVATDGTVTEGPSAAVRDFIGGFTIVEVPTRQAALEWAAKIAVACRCDQAVREFLSAPARQPDQPEP